MANRGTEEGTRRTIRGKRKAIKAQNEGIERTTLVDELANAFTRLAKEAASGAEEGGIKSVVDWAKALNSAGPGVHPGRALSTALVLASPTGSGRPFELLREKLAGEVFPCSAPVEKLSTSASAALSAAADDLTRFGAQHLSLFFLLFLLPPKGSLFRPRLQTRIPMGKSQPLNAQKVRDQHKKRKGGRTTRCRVYVL